LCATPLKVACAAVGSTRTHSPEAPRTTRTGRRASLSRSPHEQLKPPRFSAAPSAAPYAARFSQ